MRLYTLLNGILQKLNQKSEYKEVLLWTNPSPGNEFAGGTTLNLNLSSYDAIRVVMAQSRSDGRTCSDVIEVEKNGVTAFCYSDSSGIYIAYRPINTTRTSVYFSHCFLARGNSESVKNNWGIPEQIYGIKR